MIVQGDDVLKLIPQRPPIVMVDALISAQDKKTVSGFTVKADNIFVKDGYLLEPGIIENIAQSAAMGVGYMCNLNNKKVPLGFIGAIKNLNIYMLPQIADIMHTEIQVDYEVFDATLITGRVYVNEVLIAQAEMKIFLKSND
ncbi:MAG: hydroxymyristoyl-ACP dehydratase [Bacteroidota bacterium]